MQMHGDGALSLLVAECSGDFGLRCTARWQGPIAAQPLTALLGSGRCAITLGGAGGEPRYQSVVPLTGSTLAAAIEGYMGRSEQLDTRIVLCAGSHAASGLILQRIPERGDTDADGWNRIVQLGSTVTAAELAELPAPALLRRLFSEEDVRLFSGRALRFACSCSPQRVLGMLRTLGPEEVEAILEEQGRVEVTCEFCGRRYAFGPAQCRELFAAASGRDGG
jgi:molecular chaperone Hsp33